MVDLRHVTEVSPEQVAAQVQEAQDKAQRKATEEYLVGRASARPIEEQGSLLAPPGFVGYLAKYVFAHAPRPVSEVAIVAALGIMAGLAGREWTTFTNSGLNLYVVLVARSAIGKEAMHTGIATVMRAMEPHHPSVRLAFDFNEYASGPALTKGIHLNPCLLNVMGEIGHRFLAMSTGKESALNTLRKTLTDLYGKSGPQGIVGGISYSSQDNNVGSVDSVAFSLVGETTPGTFYQSITESMMGDGFMSRFLVIEYEGDRPDANPNPVQKPPEPLIEQLLLIARQSETMRSRNQFCPVGISADASEVLATFDLECTRNIRGVDDENIRQLWNRAHLKAMRVASLLAVGDKPFHPVVNLEQVDWAISLVRHGIASFEKRIRTGEVGEGTDHGREQKVLDICAEFLTMPPDKLPRDLKHGHDMQQAYVVPRRYIQQRIHRVAAFANHRLGPKAALDLALRAAMDNGKMREVKKDKLVEQFSFFGQAFRVVG